MDDATARSVGAAQMALMSGVVTQWLTDPATAPTPEEIVAGLEKVRQNMGQPAQASAATGSGN